MKEERMVRSNKGEPRDSVAFVAVMFLAFTVSLSFAGEPTPPYTLSDLIRLALERNPAIAVAKSGIEVAVHGLDAAKGERLPVITFGSGYLYSPSESKRLIRRAQLSELREGKVFNQQIIDLGAVLTIPVYTGGRIAANIELSKLNELVSRQQLSQTRDVLILNVASTYYNIVKIGKIVEATILSRKKLLESKRVVEARVTAEKAVPADLFKINARLADVDQNLIVARNGVELAHAVLNTLLGDETLGKKFVLKEDLPYKLEPVDLQRDVAIALERRPQYQIAKKQVEIQQQRVEIEGAKRWPQVFVEGTVSGAGGDKGFFPLTDDQTIGLRLAVPIFDKSLRDQIAKEQAKLLELRERLRQQKLATILDVKQAHLNVIAAENRIKVAEAVRKEAAEALRVEQTKFKVGKTTVEFVLDAQAAQLQSEVNYFQALSDFNVQKLALKKAIGLIEPSGP